MTKKWLDPQATEESKKYRNPIPSRELILEVLNYYGKASCEKICQELEIYNAQSIIAIKRRLKAMIRDDQIFKISHNTFVVRCKQDKLQTTIVQADTENYYILKSMDDGKKYVLYKNKISLQINDVILIQTADNGEANFIKFLPKKNIEIIALYYELNNKKFIQTLNRKQEQHIEVSTSNNIKINPQDIVLAKLSFDTVRKKTLATIIKNFKQLDNLDDIVCLSMHNWQLPNKWSYQVQQEILELQNIAVNTRTDLRHLDFVTIDGVNAKDFDDAVFCEKLKDNTWKLFVAIADVSHYVAIDSAIDQEALHRGNSCYFPHKMIPMLPEILATDLCSLKPLVDRLALICEMHINTQGIIKQTKFYEATIKSKARLTYNAVANLFAKKKTTISNNLQQKLLLAHELYKILYKKRKESGILEFDSQECNIILNSHNRVKNIVTIQRNDAHCLIEEFMLAANISCANFLLQHKKPAIFRVHQGLKDNAILNLTFTLNSFAIDLPKKEIEAKDLSAILQNIQDKTKLHLIQNVILKYISQAIYSTQNIGHFALVLPAYTHFTSPIRRYSDLCSHRLLKNILNKETNNLTKIQLQQFAEHCSFTEKRADKASREVQNLAKCQYMRDKIGNIYQGIITHITSFGLFVELAKKSIEGLIHVNSLNDDYYHFDEMNHTLSGNSLNKVYSLGQQVTVKVTKVDVISGRIRLVLKK